MNETQFATRLLPNDSTIVYQAGGFADKAALMAAAAFPSSRRKLGRPKIEAKTEEAIRRALKKKNRPGLIKLAKNLGVACCAPPHGY